MYCCFGIFVAAFSFFTDNVRADSLIPSYPIDQLQRANSAENFGTNVEQCCVG